MQVEQPSEPPRPLQPTYGRKVTALERQRNADTGAADASCSSPLHRLGSSPCKFDQDDTMRDTDRSCNTTISSDDEGILTKRTSAAKAIHLPSDDDDDDEISKGDQETGKADAKEDDGAYLKRFRESRAAREAEEQKRSHSDMLSSSTLSDPPTLSASSYPPGTGSTSAMTSGMSGSRRDTFLSEADHASLTPESSPSPMLARLPHSLDSSCESQKSLTSSPYITEAQKQEEQRTRKLFRESKVKELAKKRATHQVEQVNENAQIDDDDIDEVESSTSDIQEEQDGEDLPSAIKAAQLASHNRRKADDRRRAEEEAKKISKKSKGSKAVVLQMRADDDSDSDVDFSSNRATDDSRPVIKALSKKEEEMMHKTQARIERELKANQAKTLRARGERPTFGLVDLLSSFDRPEGCKKETQMIAVQKSEDANTSDPIESASEEDDNLGKKSKQFLIHRRSPSRPFERFTPVLKGLSPLSTDKTLQEDTGEDLPDASDARRLIPEDCNRRDKLTALKERKAQALKAMQLSEADKQEDDDDLILIDSKSTSSRPSATMTKPKVERSRRQPRISRHGSPGGISDEASEDDLITTGQVQRAGKALREASSIEPKGVDSRVTDKRHKGKGQTTKESAPTRGELNESIMRQARLQNIELRRKKEEALGRKKEVQKKVEVEEDTSDIIQRLREAHEKSGHPGSDAEDSDADGSEYNPEAAAAVEEGMIDLGSGEEEEEDKDKEKKIASESESGKESNDSEKENSAPASQESVQPRMPRRSRITIDDDDDQEGNQGLQERWPLQPINVDYEQEDEAAEEEEQRDSLHLAILDSSEAGFSQFFQPTQVSLAPQVSSSPPRNLSSTLGRFFEDTQPDQPLRGESFPVLMDQSDDSALPGFSQFFTEETQVPVQKNNRLMPPPTTSARGLVLLDGTNQDAFAALRKAQKSEAENLHFDADVLPSLDEVGGVQEDQLAALEMEALEAEIEKRQEKDKKRREEANVTYINKDGFFTQTKPNFEKYSLSQSQSERGRWEDGQMNGSSMESVLAEEDKQAKKRKRFRRAISMQDTEEQEEMPVSTSSINLEAIMNVNNEEEMETIAKPRDAFDVLKEAVSKRRRVDSPGPVARTKKNRFVHGEAEESDDEEEEGPAGKKRKMGRGGLGGVFSDDEDQDDQDDGDLEELIDEEKDEREAERDILARERYYKDREVDDQAALALHEKAIRGGLRNKRRTVGLNGTLEGFLDDDYEDEWLERQVKNPYGNMMRKRKLEGKDGLDLLEANEESQAFVREYRGTHEKETDLDKYSFLLPVEGEDDETQQERKTGDADSSNDEEQDNNHTPRLTHQQFRKELEDRRRKQRQAQRLSDDEDESQREAEEEADKTSRLAEEEERMMKRIQREAYGHSSSDEEDDEFATASARPIVRDRLRRAQRSEFATRRTAVEDDDEFAYSTLVGIAKSQPLTEKEQERLAQLQSGFANEPEWGDQDKNRKLSSHRNSSGTGGSITSFGSRQQMRKSASDKSTSSTFHQQQPHRVRSKLNHFMNRKNHFTESQDD